MVHFSSALLSWENQQNPIDLFTYHPPSKLGGVWTLTGFLNGTIFPIHLAKPPLRVVSVGFFRWIKRWQDEDAEEGQLQRPEDETDEKLDVSPKKSDSKEVTHTQKNLGTHVSPPKK